MIEFFVYGWLWVEPIRDRVDRCGIGGGTVYEQQSADGWTLAVYMTREPRVSECRNGTEFLVRTDELLALRERGLAEEKRIEERNAIVRKLRTIQWERISAAANNGRHEGGLMELFLLGILGLLGFIVWLEHKERMGGKR